MLKKALIPALAIIILVAVFAVFRPQREMKSLSQVEFTATNQQRQPLSFARDSDGVLRAIYAVVEMDGVYFGEQRVDFGTALAFLDATAKKEGIRAVFVCIAESARYGDVARFYVGVDKSRFYITSFPTITVPVGYRLPLTGEFRKECCSWVDKVNKQEIW